MLRKLSWTFLATFALFAACGDLPHEAPFDPLTPQSRQAAGRIQGNVVLEGEADFGQVAIELLNDAHTYSIATRNDGTFELTGIQPGEYVMRMTARSFEPYEGRLEVALGSRLALGTTTLNAKKTLLTGVAQVEKLVDGEPVTVGGVAVTLRRVASIRGASASPGYRTAASAATGVELAFTTLSAADGSYAIGAVPPGIYTAKAEAADASPANLGELTVTGEAGPMEIPAAVLRPLTGFFAIEADGRVNPEYTSSADVTLQLTGLNATEMAVAVVQNDAACVPLVRETLDALVTVSLAGEGLNRICVRYYDESGNQTEILERTITRDTTPPAAAAFLIDNGAAATNDPLGAIMLSLVAGDAASGLVSMKLANRAPAETCTDALGDAAEEPFVTTKVWSLQGPADNATRTVCLSLGDRAGNWSDPYSASILWDVAPPVAGSPAIVINGGAAWALAPQVELVFSATGASEMQITNGSAFGSAAWEPYRTAAFWVLPGSQGTHTVSVNFRDGAGNVAGPFAATITLDTQKPTSPAVSINGGALYTNQAAVTLGLTAFDASVMQVSTDGAFDAEPTQAYAGTLPFGLPGTDGTKLVYVRYGDDAGNFTDPVIGSITLDRTPPAVASFLLDGGKATSNDSLGNVTVNLAASDASSGLASLKIANRAAAGTCATALAAAVAEPFVTSKTWTLQSPSDEASRSVCVSVADRAGNWSAAVDASILWDTTVPVAGTPAITVDGGAAWAQSTQVELALFATGASEMQLANNGVFGTAAWEPYRSSAFWVLPSAQGVHTVSVNFRDSAGNVSGPYAATITLDTVKPTAPSLSINGGAQFATQAEVTLTLGANGATVMQLSSDGVFDTEPVESFAVNKAYSLPGTDGTKLVYARFGDDAGNYTDPVAALIHLDRTAPVGGTFAINSGAAYTKDANVTLTLSASGAASMYLSTAGCQVGSSWIGYMPTLDFNLGGGTGLRTVHVAYRDEAGNVSTCRSAQITYDNSFDAPGFAAAVTGAELLAGRTRNLNVWVTVSGLTADVAQIALSADASFSGAAWVPAAVQLPWVLSGGDGVRTVYVRGRDAAGNLSATLSSNITLDQTGPEVPALTVADIDGDGFAVSESQVELRWTAPSDLHLAGFEVERYVPGYSAAYEQVFSAGAVTVTFADTVTDDTGLVHFYRVRAYDNLGNYSGWSASIQAFPFAPIKQAAWLKTATGLRYLFTPNRGTFSQRASRTYEDSAGISKAEDLGLDITSWAHTGATGQFAESLNLRSSNQDNSLAYQTTYGTPLPQRSRMMDFQQGLDMARDSQGNPQMLTCGWMRLIYGVHDGAGWTTEDLPIADPCMTVAMTIDQEDKAHILYSLQSSPYSVVYMTNAAGSWGSETITAATFMTNVRPDIAVAGDGTVHALWDDQGDLWYGMRTTAGVWTVESMFRADAPSLAVDPSGTPFVAYSKYYLSGPAFWVAYRTGPSAWSATVVDDAAGWSADSALVFDAAGVLRLAYDAPDHGGLMYAAGPGLVPALVATGEPRHFNLILDDDGNPTIGYADFTADQAKLAMFDGGSWSVKPIGNISGGMMGTDYAGAVRDRAGTIHALYSQYTSGQLMYFHERADRIEETPADWVFHLSLVLDPADKAHFFYADFAASLKPYYVSNTNGTWVKSGPLYHEAAYDLSMAGDPLGRMHIAFSSASNEVVYGVRATDGTWSMETVAPSSSQPYVAVDHAGNRVLLYRSGANMYYATAASEGSFGPAQVFANAMYATLLTGQDGLIHAVYSDLDDGYVKYRSYGMGAWSMPEPIARAFRPAGIAEHNGKVRMVVYDPLAKTIVLGERGDGAWTTKVIDRNIAEPSGAPSIAVSADGWVTVLYEDKDNARFKIATDATGGWSIAPVGPGQSAGKLAQDSKGNLHMAYSGLADESYEMHYIRNFFGVMPAQSTARVSAW